MSTDGGAEAPDTTAAWLARLTAALHVESVSLDTQASVLRLARDIAHAGERKHAPLAAFVAGRHVEARARAGIPVSDALAEVADAASGLLEGSQPTP